MVNDELPQQYSWLMHMDCTLVLRRDKPPQLFCGSITFTEPNVVDTQHDSHGHD